MEKKLMFEAMPQKAWYQNLRTVLRTKDWDSLRHEGILICLQKLKN